MNPPANAIRGARLPFRANPTSARPGDRCRAVRAGYSIAAAFPTCARSALAEIEAPKRFHLNDPWSNRRRIESRGTNCFEDIRR